MSRALLVNGRPVEPGAPAIAADDPGLYGQGVYESLRTYDGRLFAVARHLDRLQRGARGLGLEPDREAVERELADGVAAARAAGLDGELTVRLLVTAGGARVVEV